MGAGRPKKQKITITKTLTIDDVKRIVAESGLKITEIERGVGMPITTLDKVINDRPTPGSGLPRTLPAKWEAPMIDFIKKKKAEKEELIEATKEVFVELNIPAKVEPVEIPDEERKLAWIEKLKEVKAELESD